MLGAVVVGKGLSLDALCISKGTGNLENVREDVSKKNREGQSSHQVLAHMVLELTQMQPQPESFAFQPLSFLLLCDTMEC